MKTYIVTVFDKKGEKLLEESFQATNDQEAKSKGDQILKEKQFQKYTSRVTSPTGKLVLFHR
jgi:hypothetical protein